NLDFVLLVAALAVVVAERLRHAAEWLRDSARTLALPALSLHRFLDAAELFERRLLPLCRAPGLRLFELARRPPDGIAGAGHFLERVRIEHRRFLVQLFHLLAELARALADLVLPALQLGELLLFLRRKNVPRIGKQLVQSIERAFGVRRSHRRALF